MWCLERILRNRHGLLSGRTRHAKTRSPGACANVLTPERIPEFCIPPRLEPSLALVDLRNAWEQMARTDEGAGRTDWDPRSQAALSLPHLPRARTAYGFCALLESPHTRRKESLFLGDPGAAAAAPLCAPRPHSAPRPRAHTYCAGAVRPRPARGGERDAPPAAPPASAPASAPAPAGPQPTADSAAARPRGRRLLRAPDGLLGRALRACGSRGSARARSASGRVKDEVERDAAAAAPESPISAPARPSPAPGPRPERLEAEGTVALSRAGCALRLAAEYSPDSGRLRLRLLRAQGPAGGALEPRAVACRLRLVLQPPGAWRAPLRAGLGRSRRAALEQDFCFDGLSEEQLRRLAVRVQAELKGRGLERGRRLGQGELLLGALLL